VRVGLWSEVSRNLRRRRLRTFLTVTGIGLGAFALTVMGSLAENFNVSISSLRQFLGTQVLVRGPGSSVFFPMGHLPVTLMDELDRVEGVGVVVPRVTVLFSDEGDAGFGPPDLVFGVDIERAQRSPIGDLRLAAGRTLEVGDRWRVVLGAELAQRFLIDGRSARPGDVVKIRGRDFEVVGVGAATSTPIDRFATASIADTREILKEVEPFLDVDSVVDEFSVFPAPGTDADVLAERLEGRVGNAMVFSPEASRQQIRQFTAIFNAIILGSALVALLVGGVAIINTMVFSVTERTREIGIKKAVGASSRDILREFLTESSVVSVVGGLAGALLGFLMVTVLNAVTRDDGVVAFTITPRLWGLVFLLSLVTGVGAGFLPARRAASIDPVRALRTLG